MKYLTQAEQRPLNAAKTYARRKLTPLETGIKLVNQRSAELRNASQERRAEATREVVRCLEEVTSNTTLINQCREALTNPGVLRQLVEKYPYVEFEAAINGTATYSGLQLAGLHDRSFEAMKNAADWVKCFYEGVRFLPHGQHAFVATPATDYRLMRHLAQDKGLPECRGIVLPKVQQELFDVLFTHHWSNPLQLVKDYGLLDSPELCSRFGVTVDTTFPATDGNGNFQLQAQFEKLLMADFSIPVLTVLCRRYPLLTAEDVGFTYRFAV